MDFSRLEWELFFRWITGLLRRQARVGGFWIEGTLVRVCSDVNSQSVKN